MLCTEELFVRTTCNCCQLDIPGIGIECIQCPGSVKLCCECFGLGAEIGQHKLDHSYRFFDSSGNIYLFPNGTTWTAKEAIRLLDGIEQYGFGNWADISKHIETKNAAESKEEYVKRFVDGSCGKATWPLCKSHERPTIDHTCPQDGPLSPSLTATLSPLRIAPDEASQLGYMSFRDDYEKEFDNEAEKLVSQLQVGSEDEEIDVALKLALVDMYSRRLRERARRKRIIRDYQLTSNFFKKPSTTTAKTKRRFLPYQKDVIEKLKSFAQFHSAHDHEHFVQNLVRERELQARIQELCKYRKNGITKLDDCVDFDKGKNDTSPVARINGTRASTVLPPEPLPPPPELDRSHNNAENRPSVGKFIASDQNENANGRNYQGRKRTPQLSSYGAANSSYTESKSEEPYSQAIDQDVVQANLLKHQGERKVTDDPFTANILNLKSSHLLTTKEQNLCVNNNLLPSQYLTIKAALLLNQSSEKPSTIKDSEWQEIINFMMTSGWF